jgi:hypothetical protein
MICEGGLQIADVHVQHLLQELRALAQRLGSNGILNIPQRKNFILGYPPQFFMKLLESLIVHHFAEIGDASGADTDFLLISEMD